MSLTRQDLKLIGGLLNTRFTAFEEKFEKKLDAKLALFPTRDEMYNYVDGKIESVREEMRAGFANMPTKDKFYEIMDVVHKRYVTVDQEHEFLAEQVRRHSREISELQQKVGI